MPEYLGPITRWDDSPVAAKLADLMALLNGEHPAKVYTGEGYQVWLRGVASQLVVAARVPELLAVVQAAQEGHARSQCGSCDYGLAMGCTCNPMDTALSALSGAA